MNDSNRFEMPDPDSNLDPKEIRRREFMRMMAEAELQPKKPKESDEERIARLKEHFDESEVLDLFLFDMLKDQEIIDILVEKDDPKLKEALIAEIDAFSQGLRYRNTDQISLEPEAEEWQKDAEQVEKELIDKLSNFRERLGKIIM